MVQPTENSLQLLKKLKNHQADPAIPLPGIYPNELKAGTHNRYLYTNVYNNIIHSSQKVEATHCSGIEEWVSKTEYYTMG